MKLYKRVIALTSAGMLAVSSSAAAFADEPLPSSMNSIITALHGSDVRYYELETMTSYNDYNSRKEKFSANRDHTVGNAGLPSKFDLRDVDGKCYVSSVKKSGSLTYLLELRRHCRCRDKPCIQRGIRLHRQELCRCTAFRSVGKTPCVVHVQRAPRREPDLSVAGRRGAVYIDRYICT